MDSNTQGMEEKLSEAAAIALTECLNLGRKEQLLVVCDPPCAEVGEIMWKAGVSRCREAVMVVINPRRENGNEPPGPVGKWFGQFDVAVMPTSKSLSHTRARRRASERGVRIATLPGISPEMFVRTMKTDWHKLGIATRKLAAHLSSASRVRVTSPGGTDIAFETGGRHAKADDGRLNFRGAFGNLPAGEAYLAPLEGTAEGTLVFDGSFPLAGILDEPLVLHVCEGRVVETEGHDCARKLEELFLKYRGPSRTIAEFGVGTLDSARITGNVLEDEKVKGTVHFALGDNASMGGKVNVPLHLDGVVRAPSVWLDNKLWLDHGTPVRGNPS